MYRRGFLNDVTEVGIGLGVTASLLHKGADLAAPSPQKEAGQTHQKRESVRSNRSQAATPVVIWAKQAAGKPVWPVIPRSPDLIGTTRNLALR